MNNKAMKRVDNIELKLITLEKKLKDEQQGHEGMLTPRENKLQKMGKTQKTPALGQSTIASKYPTIDKEVSIL
jgi:hypothetical protein